MAARARRTTRTADFGPPLDEAAVATLRLERNHLAPRAGTADLVRVAGDLLGLHAQVFSSAEMSALARMEAFEPGALARALWDDRSLVKTWLIRGTLHVIRADDLPLFVACFDQTHEFADYWLRGYGITADELRALLDAIPKALDGRALTRRQIAAEVAHLVSPEVAKHLESGWGSLLKPAARRGLLVFGPNDGRETTFVRPDQWLPRWRTYEPLEAATELLRRYLRTWGPATRDDFEHWFAPWIRPLRGAWDSLAPGLVEVSPKKFALATDVERLRSAGERAEPGPGAEPVVRLLPAFDPLLLAYDDREQLIPRAWRERVYIRKNGWINPTLLVGSQIRGVWSYEKGMSRGEPALRIRLEPFEPLDAAAASCVEGEARRIAAFLGGRLELTLDGE